MAASDERIAYLEGQIVLLPQVIGQVAERLARAETTLGQRIDHVEATLGQRIDRVEATLGQRIDGVEVTLRGEIVQVAQQVHRLEDKMSRAFYWLLGIQITTFVTTLAAILGVFYIRG